MIEFELGSLASAAGGNLVTPLRTVDRLRGRGGSRKDAAMTDGGYPAAGVLHWYDFICPFCYLAQPDNDALIASGIGLTELAFIAHPELPPGGTPFSASGPRFDMIAELAAQRHLPLRWLDRLPDTRTALAAAEWVRLNQPNRAQPFRRMMFAANFDQRLDIGRLSIVLTVAAEAGVDPDRLRQGLNDGGGKTSLRTSTAAAQELGVRGTPAWWYKGRLIEGLPAGGLVNRIASIT